MKQSMIMLLKLGILFCPLSKVKVALDHSTCVEGLEQERYAIAFFAIKNVDCLSYG